MNKFEKLFADAQDMFSGVTTDDIEEAAQWELNDGSTIEAHSLGRDFGFDIIAKDADGNIKAYVCSDNGAEKVAEDLDDIDKAVSEGIHSIDAIFGMWENGFGGSAFDEKYFPDY